MIIKYIFTGLVLNVFVTLLVYMFFPKRTTPLTYESKLSMESHQSAKMFHSLKTLVTYVCALPSPIDALT